MSDYISREEIYKIFYRTKASDEIVGIYEKILDLPSADVRENIHGEWKAEFKGGRKLCSNCGIFNFSKYKNFCPNCGADMKGGE